jgi:hypothetical protein
MININSAMFDQLTYNNFGSISYNGVMYVFDGTYDFDSIIEDESNTTGSFYNLGLILSDLEAAGAVRRGGIVFEKPLYARRPNENTVVFPLSESTSELTKYSEGNVTWFMYIRTYASVDTEAKLETPTFTGYQLVVGSIGDIGSGADMEIPGAAISNDKDYKVTDLVLNLV